jgi:NADH-quinone oxidoreductase subunit J
MTSIVAAAEPTTGEAVMFWILAPIAVLAAASMLFAKKAVHSAILLAVTMVVLAVFYIAQDAPFLGIVQIVVYTGAIMMLFLFVLMVVGVDSSDSLVETLRGQRVAALVAAIGFAGLLIGGLGRATYGQPKGLAQANAQGNVQAVAEQIFTRWVWAFEVTSALLITAALGAMILTHREEHERQLTQRELSEQRFRSSFPMMLPGPGVYARHNAVDTPGLLPDGSPSELTVSQVLLARGDVRSTEPVAHDVEELEASVDEAASGSSGGRS